jgi:hypothetical protein
VSDRLTVVVSGMVAGDPGQGGATWAVVNLVLGLRRLGHRVVVAEPVDRAGDGPLAGSRQATYFDAVRRRFGIEGALVRTGGTETVGMGYGALARVAAEADLLLNVAGMLQDPELLQAPRRRAYLDLDPAFTQLWHDADGIDMRLAGHEHHVTVGLLVGTPGCTVPACGVSWLHVPPVVSLADWEVGDGLAHDAFTTVGNWRGYGSIEHGGVHYGQRAHSMRGLAALPGMVPERLSVALAIHPDEADDLALLRREGWELLDPAVTCSTPDGYQAFVRGSKGEIGIAKSGYVASRCGWFSDRSACYLAAGRPVVAQDTGFGDVLPTGMGLLRYADAGEAAEALRAVTADYERHRRAARAIAAEHLDARRVLPPLLEALT